MVYYNYRHYNTRDGRWCNKDFIIDSNQINLYVLKNTIYLYDSRGLRVNAVFVGSQDDRAYSNVEGDIMCMDLKSNTKPWIGEPVNYTKSIDIIRSMSDKDFDAIVKAGNLQLKEYKELEVGRITRRLKEGVVLNDSRANFIARAERELNSSSNVFQAEFKNQEDALNRISKLVSDHFVKIKDAMDYDYNLFIMHGNSDGTVDYLGYRITEISRLKNWFEKTKYNAARNLFVSCYMKGYSILAGVRPAVIHFEDQNGCKKISFTPTAPWYSNANSV